MVVVLVFAYGPLLDGPRRAKGYGALLKLYTLSTRSSASTINRVDLIFTGLGWVFNRSGPRTPLSSSNILVIRSATMYQVLGGKGDLHRDK